MEAIFSFKKDHNEDYYTILGCDELSSSEQICAEYKVKALLCHPDKHPDCPDAGKTFASITEAKDTLCDPERRKQYDDWRRCGLAIPYTEWKARKDTIHTSLHWALKKKKEPALEEGPSTRVQTPDQLARNAPVSRVSNSCGWERDDVGSSSLLAKFRNYQI